MTTTTTLDKDQSLMYSILERTQKEAEAEKSKSVKRRLNLDISKQMFNALMESNLDKLIYQSGKKGGFVPDKNASILFTYLFHYATGKEVSNIDLDKGILIAGNYGIGKTLIFSAFCNLIESLGKKKINTTHSKKLVVEVVKDQDVFDRMTKGLLFIDDLGKEPKSINTFGTITNPMEDILTARYENNALTFATGNLKLETYKEHYGGSVYDRMKAMFNIVELKGKSKR